MKKKYGGLVLEKMKPLEQEFGGMTAIPKIHLFKDGNAIPYLPEEEKQIGVYFDTWGCVSFSNLNCVETVSHRMLPLFRKENREWLLKNFYKNDRPNFSDRDLVVLSGTEIGRGNSARQVLETVQQIGVIPEEKEPWDFTSRDPEVNIPEVYYAYSRTEASNQIAREFNKRFKILGERVAQPFWKEASQYGALQVFVNAWYQDDDGTFFNPTGNHNHAVQMADYNTVRIFDSYKHNGSFLKTLSNWSDARWYAYKFNIIEKNMEKPKIENNTLLQTVTPNVAGSGQFGIYLDDQIIVGDEGKLSLTFFQRNNGDIKGKTLTLTKDDWDKFEKIDLSGNKI